MKVLNILEGAIKYAIDYSDTLRTQRLEKGCKKCKLSHDDNDTYTGICSLKSGGCGCVVALKTYIHDDEDKCPLGIWYDETVDLNRLKEVNKRFNFTKQ